MNPQEFEKAAQVLQPDFEFAQKAAIAYGNVIPPEILALCTMEEDGVFLEVADKFCRKMAVKEILNAKDFLQVDFVSHGFIPVFDCGDNDFLGYRFSDKQWIKFNIVDEVAFNESSDWKVLI